MSRDNPVQRRIAWSSLAVHLPIMAALMGLMYWVAGLRPWTTAMMAGAALYLLWSGLSKSVALRHHRTGLQLVQAGLFDQAAAAFTKSYEHLSRYLWVDRYRYVVLLDSSGVCYREMALVNKAYSHLRGGAVGEALETYRAALREYPRSTLARDGQLECEKLLAMNRAI